ncbi:unnamed protein product [Ilex paraguariensis]|uniref:RING-type domain-containing protein n=1 Tax=Ilex paraguariensis TaxID=185542 RepID=A0ABC8QUA0_9AQUA
MGTHEPYWQTNSSFSPPPSRWDFRFQSDGLSLGSPDGIPLNGSSTSSNSRESQSWMRGSHFANHQYVTSDVVAQYFSSPSDISPAQQWTPPAIQDISVDDYGTSRRGLGPLSFSPTMEGTSAAQDSRGSTSSRSDSSGYEPMVKSHSPNRHFSSRRCFMSKPVHPVCFPSEAPTREASDTTAIGLSEFDATTPHREKNRLSSASGSIEFKDVSESFESDLFGQSCNPSDVFTCGLCKRFLSQRSPWSSRRIVRSGDMPIAGVLSCCHVFHAECLEQTTPKTCKNDPPCPLCLISEGERSPELRVISKLGNVIPMHKPFSEDGPSRPWGCAQVGDCVEGALRAPPRNYMLLLNRNRLKKNLSLKGHSGKEFPGKPRKSGSYLPQLFTGSVDQGSAGSSNPAQALQ